MILYVYEHNKELHPLQKVNTLKKKKKDTRKTILASFSLQSSQEAKNCSKSYRIRESLRLKKKSKTIKSNCELSTAKSITKLRL